jgi:uncharacterized protein YjaZ
VVAPAAAGARAGRKVPRTGNPHGDSVAVGISTYGYLVVPFMPTALHILSASLELKSYQRKIHSTAKAVFKAVGKVLPIKDVEVVVYKNPSATIREIGGIGGYTQVANIIFISLDPSHTNFKKAIGDELFKTLVHELHHAIRWQKPVAETLLEAVVSEGLADHFVTEITGNKKPAPWSDCLTSGQKKNLFKKAKREWLKTNYDHSAWFFGTSKSIPRWAGYSLGYALVKDYLESHPGVTASDLVFAPAKSFLK